MATPAPERNPGDSTIGRALLHALDTWGELFGSPPCMALFGVLWALVVAAFVALLYFDATAP